MLLAILALNNMNNYMSLNAVSSCTGSDHVKHKNLDIMCITSHLSASKARALKLIGYIKCGEFSETRLVLFIFPDSLIISFLKF